MKRYVWLIVLLWFQPLFGQAPSLEVFVRQVLRFENLKPGQTPIRKPEGTRWKHIQGYPVVENPLQYPDRKNFFFVKPEHVVPVTKEQFLSYVHRLPAEQKLPDVLKVYCPPQHRDIGRYLDQHIGYSWREPTLRALRQTQSWSKGGRR